MKSENFASKKLFSLVMISLLALSAFPILVPKTNAKQTYVDTPPYAESWYSGDLYGFIGGGWNSYADSSIGYGYADSWAEAIGVGIGFASSWFGLADYWTAPASGLYLVDMKWRYQGEARVFSFPSWLPISASFLKITASISVNFGGIEASYEIFRDEHNIFAWGVPHPHTISGTVHCYVWVELKEGSVYRWYSVLKGAVILSVIGLPSPYWPGAVKAGSIDLEAWLEEVRVKPVGDVINTGLTWLQKQQNPDGSWTYFGVENVGITSLSALAFLNRGILNDDVKKALDWILDQKQADGSLTVGPGGWPYREDVRVYDTSMAVLALVAARSLGYTPDGVSLDAAIDDAVNFLLRCQCVGTALDGYNYGYSDLNYGGWGYPRYQWADLSNTQFAVLALAAATTAGVSTVSTDVWKNAAVFTIRCLNDPRYNPRWYRSSDKGFAYRPRDGSRGSMTGAGIWTIGLCKAAGISVVTVDDVSVYLEDAIEDGLTWLGTYGYMDQNYPNGNYFYYYYLLSIAKAYVIVGKGEDWYENMVDRLIATQAGDGHWPEVYVEEPDIMATAEAILAMETRMQPPPAISPSLWIILSSYANLWVTDPQGRHIGIDPQTGQIINEIPGATFTTDLEQIVFIPNPLIGDYDVDIVGINTGPYTLTFEGRIEEQTIYEETYTGTITEALVRGWTTTISTIAGPLTVITTQIIPLHSVFVSIEPSTMNVLPTHTGSYTVAVHNTGAVKDTYLIAVKGADFNGEYRAFPTRIPSEWITLNATSVTLDPDTSKAIVVNITVPENWAGMENATYDFCVNATCEADPEVFGIAEANLTIITTKRSMTEYARLELIWLNATVTDLNIKKDVKIGLIDKLTNATKKVDQAIDWIKLNKETQANNMLSASQNMITAFINQVKAQRGKAIPQTIADELIAKAQLIIADIEKAKNTTISKG